MTRSSEALFSVLVTAMFATLLLIAGGAGVPMAIALLGCSVYRARCALVRLTHYHQQSAGAHALHA